MIAAVFSDVHANLPALEELVHAVRGTVDAYVCLGDVVNYGPWNDECLELVTALPGIVFLEGNHERLFRGDEPLEAEGPLVQEFHQYSVRSFSRRDLITGLPKSYELGPFECRHTVGERTIYPDTKIDLDGQFMIGHSHHQFALSCARGRIVNCGSVGQNRGRVGVLNYALYEAETDEVTLCQREYPVGKFMRELAARGYSARCIEYYRAKL